MHINLSKKLPGLLLTLSRFESYQKAEKPELFLAVNAQMKGTSKLFAVEDNLKAKTNVTDEFIDQS